MLQIEDRLNIADLLTKFAFYVDCSDYERVSELFTEDGSYESIRQCTQSIQDPFCGPRQPEQACKERSTPLRIPVGGGQLGKRECTQPLYLGRYIDGCASYS